LFGISTKLTSDIYGLTHIYGFSTITLRRYAYLRKKK
jgi:hypothetical protein